MGLGYSPAAMVTTVLLYIAVAIAGCAIVWKGSALLERSSERLSRYYRLPDVVQGAVVVAVGSSFPELTTTVLSTLIHGEFELGVAAIVGSAIFNILVIPGISGLVSPGLLSADRDIVYKEAQFYMIAVAVLLLTFSFAVIYNPVAATHPGEILGSVDRNLALIPLAVYGLYLWLQWQDTLEFATEPSTEPISVAKEWLVLLASLALIVIGVEGLIRAALVFGEVFDTPTFLWGTTVVAAGTSVPDAFISIRTAKHGKDATSIANVLGSNVFDLLVAIPAGVLIAGAATINYAVAGPMMGVLTLATIVLFVFMRRGMSINRQESWFLLALYVLFVTWVALESFDIVDLVPTLPPGT